VVSATTTATLTYAGYLTDSNGNPLDGSYSIVFRLFDSESGGTELDSYSATVSVSDGYFTQDISFDRDYFDGRGLWLEIEVNGETLSPRISLSDVPYAVGIRPGLYVESLANSYLACFNNTGGSKAELAKSGTLFDVNPPMLVETWDYGVVGRVYTGPWGVLGFYHFSVNQGSRKAGVYGEFQNATGMLGTEVNGKAVGVYGVTGDYGVYGNGTEIGVYGVGDRGVYGKDVDTGSYGILGNGDYGVYGNGTEIGVYGVGDRGVYGKDVDTGSYGILGNGDYGVHGVGGEMGVYGVGTETGVYGVGTERGVYGTDGAYRGVLGGSMTIADSFGNTYTIYSGAMGHYRTCFLGFCSNYYGALGATVDGIGYSFYGDGDFRNYGDGKFHGSLEVTDDLVVSGTKNFVMQHPVDKSKKIYYASLEGPEAGIYIRGTSKLENGYAIIELPDYFALIASGQLTAQVTAKLDSGKFTIVNVEEITKHHLVVRGIYIDGTPSNAEFDYVVYAERLGYENFEPIRGGE
jgi:hypothetical protein